MSCCCSTRSRPRRTARSTTPPTITVERLATSLDARDALLWKLTVLGEATGQLPADLRDSHPEILWSQPVRLRNRVVHGYWSVDLDVIHSVAVLDLPGFVAQVEAVAASLAVEP